MKLQTFLKILISRRARAVIFSGLAALILVSGSARSEDADILVPVSFTGESIPQTHQYFLTPQRFAILSSEGEPIDLIINNRSRDKMGEVSLLDASGAWISTQAVEPAIQDVETEPHEIRFEVPKPGVYFIEYTGENPLWTITIPEGVSSVLCLEPEKLMTQSGTLGRRYFYVPVGTEEIRYAAKAGHLEYTMNVVDPDGIVVQVVDQDNPAQPIQVNSGADGKVWSFHARSFAPIRLSFENIPNFLAIAPDALLLPKSVVEKDGL